MDGSETYLGPRSDDGAANDDAPPTDAKDSMEGTPDLAWGGGTEGCAALWDASDSAVGCEGGWVAAWRMPVI